jgi:AcrR family transcriptional regulator
MHVMQNMTDIGRRQRKKLDTRKSIERAAVHIALEHGYEAATAEAIARRADISLRTFFNYFPSKDAALVGPGIHLDGEQDALRILEENAAHLLKGICRVTEASVAAMSPASDIMQDRRRLFHQEPHLHFVFLTALVKYEMELTTLVASYLGTHPDRRRLAGLASVEEEAGIAVAMVAAAVRYSVELWTATDDDPLLHAQDIERTIDLMSAINRKDS